MEKSVKTVSVATITLGIITGIAITVAGFSSHWILGDLESTYKVIEVENNGRGTTNTSGSCHQGILMACCTKHNYTYIIYPTGYKSYNLTDTTCSFDIFSNFNVTNKGAYSASRVFTVLALPSIIVAVIIGFLFLLISRFHHKILLPAIQMALLYTAGFFFMVAISSMGIKYKDFTSLLEPTTGWSMYAGVAAELLVLFTALLSTATLVLMKRYSSPQYGNF